MKLIAACIAFILLSCGKEVPQPLSQIYNKYVTVDADEKWHGFYFNHPFTIPPMPIPFAIIYTFPLDGAIANVAISFYGGADADFNPSYIYIRQTDSVAVDCPPMFTIEKIYCNCDSIYYNGNSAMVFFNGIGSIEGIFLRNNLQ